MSTTLRLSPPLKKMSSCVRPGVREMRARFLRPVSALMRLDLPTLDRPAKAISTPRMEGSDTADPAAAIKRQSPANKRRPASISARVNWTEAVKVSCRFQASRKGTRIKRDRRDRPGDQQHSVSGEK